MTARDNVIAWLCHALGIEEKNLPYVAELIRLDDHGQEIAAGGGSTRFDLEIDSPGDQHQVARRFFTEGLELDPGENYFLPNQGDPPPMWTADFVTGLAGARAGASASSRPARASGRAGRRAR